MDCTSQRRELMASACVSTQSTGHWGIVEILIHFTAMFFILVCLRLLQEICSEYEANRQYFLPRPFLLASHKPASRRRAVLILP